MGDPGLPHGLLQLEKSNQPSCSAMLTYPARNRQTNVHVLIDSGNCLWTTAPPST